MDDWTSVTIKFPERSGRYLCYFGDHPLGGFCDIVNYNADERAFWSYKKNISVSFITHWMPLPLDPPRENLNKTQ